MPVTGNEPSGLRRSRRSLQRGQGRDKIRRIAGTGIDGAVARGEQRRGRAGGGPGVEANHRNPFEQRHRQPIGRTAGEFGVQDLATARQFRPQGRQIEGQKSGGGRQRERLAHPIRAKHAIAAHGGNLERRTAGREEPGRIGPAHEHQFGHAPCEGSDRQREAKALANCQHPALAALAGHRPRLHGLGDVAPIARGRILESGEAHENTEGFRRKRSTAGRTISWTNAAKSSPAQPALFGKRLVSFMPGRVLISSK